MLEIDCSILRLPAVVVGVVVVEIRHIGDVLYATYIGKVSKFSTAVAGSFRCVYEYVSTQKLYNLKLSNRPV